MFFQKFLLTVALSGVAFSALQAEVKHETVAYKAADGTDCEGYLSADDAVGGAQGKQKPGVLVVHDWMGLTDGTKAICDRLAQLGYVAFAADIYGKGVRPADAKEAGGLAGKYKNDRALLRKRVLAGYEQLAANKQVAQDKLAVIGYCFGGTTAIELGRAGANLQGIVSFHGGLDSPNPADGKNIKAHVLILHGADDPLVKQADIDAFLKELKDNKVDYEMISYGDAVHAFTVKTAGNDKSKGVAYNEKADRRSWQAMRDFFGEIFGGK